MRRHQNGFTLLEIMLVLGLLVVLTLAAIPSYTRLQTGRSTSIAKAALLEHLQLARAQARAGYAQNPHGVYISGEQYTLYAGETYETRDTQYDQTYYFPMHVIAAGISDVSFALGSGNATATGTITLSHEAVEDTHIITVASYGILY